MTKKLKVDGKRSKIKREREIRLKARLKQSQKKRVNDELFQMLNTENLDKLNIQSRKESLSTLFKLVSSFPYDNSDKYSLLLIFLQDKSSKVVLKAIRLIKKLLDDLVPSYKVRDGETTQKQSKEVESIRKFEVGVLKLYEEFIKNLSVFIKAFKKDNPSTNSIRQHSFLVLSQLLEKFYYFNHVEMIYKILIEGLYDHDSTIRSTSYEGLNKVLSILDNSASMLELKLNIIKLICHYVFIKPHENFNPNVLDLFTSHRIEFPDISKKKDEKVDLDNIKYGRKLKFEKPNKVMTKQQISIEKREEKKHTAEKNKIIREMKKEMSEYDNTPDPRNIYYSNLKILKKILLVYFDIIKYKRDSPLIRSVLRGIGILSENINIEILFDLQKCLYSYVQYVLTESANIKQKIFSITALKTCLNIMDKLTKEIVSVDDTNLTGSTYLFLHVIGNSYIKELTKDDLFILLEIIEMLLIKNRQFALDIVGAFIKKLAWFITKLQDEQYIPSFLLLLKRVVERYPNLQSMVDINDEDHFAHSCTDPGLSNGRLTNICGEINKVQETFKTSKTEKGKLIRQLTNYIKTEKINPIFSSMNYFDILI
jgi:hypothetical protein